MAPSKPRVIDDARSETSMSTAITKERVNHNQYTKRKAMNALVNGASSSSLSKVQPTVPVQAVPAIPEEPPHIDWSSLSAETLNSYRSAHRLQIPSSYRNPHADILYKSSSIARKAPSQCLARRKNHDLKAHRAKSTDNRKSRKKHRTEEPPSPKSHPSLLDSEGKSPISDDTPSIYLNPNPEDTIIGRSTTQVFASTIRTHFNAQQVNEAETLARFAYMVRQQGADVQSKKQRIVAGQLLNTTAENIAAVAEAAKIEIVPEAVASVVNGKAPAVSRSAPNPISRVTKVMSNADIEVEGSYGDGKGGRMSTTSSGRQVRIGEGHGSFRLRFRP